MRVFSKGTAYSSKAGTWLLWSVGDGEKPAVIIYCPDCGFSGVLDHTIKADGTVEPSVECPSKGCSFHEHVRLGDWTPL